MTFDSDRVELALTTWLHELSLRWTFDWGELSQEVYEISRYSSLGDLVIDSTQSQMKTFHLYGP